MAEFDVIAVSDWMRGGMNLGGEPSDGDDGGYDCLEQACAAAGVYCERISARLAARTDADPPTMTANVDVVEFRGRRRYLRAQWELRADGWFRVKP